MSDIATIQLPARLDASAAPELLDMLRTQAAPARLDAAKVEQLSTACIEVLLSAAASGFQLTGASVEFTAGFAELGLLTPLGDWLRASQTAA